jgi:hypothetical protein
MFVQFCRGRSGGQRRRATYRPVVEHLEDRAVPAFLAIGTFSTGAASRGIALGNLVGDANVDVVTANNESDDVSVLAGNGVGGFGPAATFPVEMFGRPVSVAVANFNGDTRLDLVTANLLTNSVTVLLGTGPGHFGPPPSLPQLLPANPRGVAIGDFNRDGPQDIITANASGSISVLLGTGTGEFAAPINQVVPGTSPMPTAVVVTDFDGDGIADAAVANSGNNTVTVFTGFGLKFSSSHTVGVGAGPVALAVGDFNGDGRPDLATANQFENDVTVLLNTGGGGFTSAGTFPVRSIPVSIVAGDFNADGKQDVAVAEAGADGGSILVGDGGGHFSPGGTFSTGPGSAPQAVTAADLDHDGHPELIVVGTAGVTVLRGQADPFTSPGGPSGPGSPGAPALDLTPRLHVLVGKLRPAGHKGRARQIVTLFNTSGDAIAGPIYLVLDGLNGKIRLRNSNGASTAHGVHGSPYVTLTLAGGALAPAGSAKVVLDFVNPRLRKVRYTPLVVEGPGLV